MSTLSLPGLMYQQFWTAPPPSHAPTANCLPVEPVSVAWRVSSAIARVSVECCGVLLWWLRMGWGLPLDAFRAAGSSLGTLHARHNPPRLAIREATESGAARETVQPCFPGLGYWKV